LAAAGRRAEALKHHQDFVTLLKRELNTEPDAATKSLVAELRGTQPPSRSPTAKESANSVLPQPERPPIAVLPPAKISRDLKEEVNAENPAELSEVSAAPVRPGNPKRRQLTIMVCHTVSSVPASGRFDAGDMHDPITAFHKAVADVVARFD
jgi:hypothetical protein